MTASARHSSASYRATTPSSYLTISANSTQTQDLAISCSGNYRSGMVMQGASSEVLMRVNSIVGGGGDAHKEGEAQIEQDGGGAPHIMKLKVC
ncbi:uncharacterized protein LOC120685646 isoform X2 [Panicum virgatum]|nr:uncharacterized protein LOC120685646 isoform X2 [Panicum virgatum]